MNKIKSILNYLLWIPFGISTGAFVLYFRYFFTGKSTPDVEVINAINLVMERYLKIGLFSLFVGLLLVFINKISKVIFNEDKYYNEKYPWTDLKNNVNTNEKINNLSPEKEEKSFEVENELPEDEYKEDSAEFAVESDYIINEIEESNEPIAQDLKNNDKIEARLIEDDANSLETLIEEKIETALEEKRQTIIKVDSSKVKIDGFKHCPKCSNLIVDDAVICVHCGILLDESLRERVINQTVINNKNKKFNLASLAINAIIILVSLIIIILLCSKIGTQKTENEANLNTQSNLIENMIKK